MEYAAKGRLQDCLPLSELQAQGYFLQIVDAVEYLHEVVRVIHRDIKPDNILLDREGNIKVSDFGSSQTMRNPDDTFTNTPGTPAFLSPEQCGGTKEFLGKPLDIWAMGVTLYYMLCNRPPFVARRLGALYESIKSEEVSLSQEISPELKDLITRLLEKNPLKRIQLPELKEHPWMRRPTNQSYA
jgi:[calcium/calmodulin-dependent protein kinase] kinase